MTSVNIHDAKNHFSSLVGRAHIGEKIIIAKPGKPYARLVPLLDTKGKRMSVIAKGAVTDGFFEPLLEDELAKWES